MVRKLNRTETWSLIRTLTRDLAKPLGLGVVLIQLVVGSLAAYQRHTLTPLLQILGVDAALFVILLVAAVVLWNVYVGKYGEALDEIG